VICEVVELTEVRWEVLEVREDRSLDLLVLKYFRVINRAITFSLFFRVVRSRYASKDGAVRYSPSSNFLAL
jgi:hypothetical protein